MEGLGKSQPALCTRVCEQRVCTSSWSGALDPEALHVRMPATGETWIQGPVTGQTECLSTAVSEIHNVHLYIFLLISHLSCHRGEAVGSDCVPVSAGCFCLCYLCGWPSIYVYRSCICMPTRNTFSAMPLAGLGGMELWQPCLCQAAGFSHIP